MPQFSLAKPLLSTALGVLLIGCSAAPTPPAPTAPIAAPAIPEAENFGAILEGTAFVTDDIEGLVSFYTELLGFRVLARKTLDNEITRTIFGLEDGQALDYVSMFPIGATREEPLPGVHAARVINLDGSPVTLKPNALSQDPNRPPVLGDMVSAFLVSDITEIETKMKAANVPFLSPLTLSATGRSMTLNVLDPNGVRLQLYEYVK